MQRDMLATLLVPMNPSEALLVHQEDLQMVSESVVIAYCLLYYCGLLLHVKLKSKDYRK